MVQLVEAQAGRSQVRIPVVLEFFIDNPGRIMAVGSTRCLTEMSRRNIFLGSKSGWCIGLTTLPPSCAYCLEIREPKPLGTLRACPGIYRDCFTFNLLPEQLLCELSKFYQIKVLDGHNGTSHTFVFQAFF